VINYKNYTFNVNEDFVMFLISKLITCFINGSTSGMKSQSVAYLPIGKVRIKQSYLCFLLDIRGTLKMRELNLALMDMRPSQRIPQLSSYIIWVDTKDHTVQKG
jgi:hypothetical protein